MEKQFVPFELAVKLKYLGFNEDCFGYYNEENGKLTTGTYYCFDNPMDFVCLSPLWQQAFDWFRDKYNLHSYLIPDGYWEIEKYYYRIDSKDKNLKIELKTPINSEYTIINSGDNYIEARLACLEKLIEIVSK